MFLKITDYKTKYFEPPRGQFYFVN